MANGEFFDRTCDPLPDIPADAAADTATLLNVLSQHVVERFLRLNGTGVQAVPVALPDAPDAEDPPPNPCHPECRQFAQTEYCQESWQLHLAELERCPRSHWHRCQYERYCAYVPVAFRGRCLAVVKIASSAAMSEPEFARHVELLDLLAQDFVNRQAGYCERVLETMPSAGRAAEAFDQPQQAQPPSAKHPKIIVALRCIEEWLGDPALTVERIATRLELHPTYLSRLFAEQTGQRMSRFIAARRIEKARHLLATTDWQIKRIALETGHANPNWFCHVFQQYTGLTPGDYRSELRQETARRGS